MEKLNQWMLAAILTICGAMTMGLTSCTDSIDNPVTPVTPEPEPEQQLSKYTIDEIRLAVRGGWIDEVMYSLTDQVKLYDIYEDGKCDVYDLSTTEVPEGAEVWDGETDPSLLDPSLLDAGTTTEEVSVVQYSGTWTVTNDLSKVSFVEKLNLDDYELMGALMLKTEMLFDEDSQFKALGGRVEKNDTLAVLIDKEADELLIIDTDDINLLINLYETGMITDGDAVATRAGGSTQTSEEIEKKIKEITDNKNYQRFLQPSLSVEDLKLSDWMGQFYKGLNPRLCDLSIPGARGIFTATYFRNENKDMMNEKIQYSFVTDLWKHGVRFFDLGAFDHSTFSTPESANYEYDDPLLNDPSGFRTLVFFMVTLKIALEEHPTETAIIMFNRPLNDQNYSLSYLKHFNNKADGYKEVTKLIHDVLAEYADITIMDYAPGIRLNDCRGKIVVMNCIDEEFMADGAKLGLNLYTRWSPWTLAAKSKGGMLRFPNGESAKIYEQTYKDYALEGNTEPTVKLDAISKTWDYAKGEPDVEAPVWVFNYAAGCLVNPAPSNGTRPTYRNYSFNSFYANPHVERLFRNNIGRKTGIVVFDYVGKSGRGSGTNSEFDCKGATAPLCVALNNFYMVKDHSISLDEGDTVK